MNDNKEDRAIQIACLQQNLSAIRKIAGWTTEQLGDKIGVTKQTISNLENGKTPMSLTQYIAIRSILDHEIQTNKENTTLPQVVTILLDKNTEYTEAEKEKIQETVKTVAATAAGGIAGTQLASLSAGLLGGLVGGLPGLIVGGTIATTSSTWLKKLLGKNNNQ